MNNQFRRALEPIHATDKIKYNICAFLHGKISSRQRKSRALLRYAVPCCAMLALMICGIGGYSLYTTPISYISVDVNPSIELGLNRLNRVVAVSAYNDDGAMILQNLNLKNRFYTEAVELLLTDKIFESYLAEDALLSFTVVSDKEEVLLAGIRQCRGYAEANAECHGANVQLVDEAHHNGLSFGKYQAFLKLSQYDRSITAEECNKLSMRQIRDMISQYEGVSDTSVGEGQGNGHHDGGRSEHGNGHRGGSSATEN